MRNLTRNEPSNCVMLRVMRQKEKYEENFSVKQYGSWAAADRAAKLRLKELEPTLPSAIPTKNRKTRRNASGVVGVNLKSSVKHGDHGSWTYLCWHAFWPGKPSGTSWGIAKYGDERAFISACISRELETTDREQIENEYHRIKGSAKYKQLLKLKSQEPK